MWLSKLASMSIDDVFSSSLVTPIFSLKDRAILLIGLFLDGLSSDMMMMIVQLVGGLLFPRFRS